MMPDPFVFTPGIWIGEGKITITLVAQFLKFYTKWEIKEESPGCYQAYQIIENVGTDEKLFNTYRFFDLKNNTFKVHMKNDLFGEVEGKGIIDTKTIAWEFTKKPLNGYEVYEVQENGDYLFHAEYISSEDFSTTVEGLIWKKA